MSSSATFVLQQILQVFYFHHLHLMTRDTAVLVMESVSELLSDPQIEVRQLASVTLAGLIRCSQRDAIDTLRRDFEEQLESSKLPKGKAKASSLPSDLIIRRHAAILGLSALVEAFPYEVPNWVPEVLVLLAGCIANTAPISAAVSKTFANFRRTHQDTWHQDMLAYTEDQLYVLSDLLVSPSYYA